jgi:hypothetical protein
MCGEHAAPRDIISEPRRERKMDTMSSSIDYRLHVGALIRGGLKLLVDPAAPMSYSIWNRTPLSVLPNPPALSAKLSALPETLRSKRAALAQRSAAVREQVPLDPAARERLHALGYGN